MATTRYSHAFLVTRINTKADRQALADLGWEHAVTSQEDYADYCSIYYRGHVNAMVEYATEAADQTPAFLRPICHYRLPVLRQAALPQLDYGFKICHFHLFFFPLDITLLAIEVDDSGNTLDALTWGHGQLMGWSQNYKKFPDDVKALFEPLAKLLPSNDITKLCADGNKLKLYQVINVAEEEVSGDQDAEKEVNARDALLYELATSTPIGCVNKPMWISPSREYFDHIMKQNSVSAYRDWKALALNDSFTMLDVADKSPIRETWDDNYKLWLNHYFRLIYLRCFLEKTFCFSRNNAYRQDLAVENLSAEIADMEKYYFYTNISYNFLPDMLYEAIAKGLDLSAEREEISKQIKERAQEEKRLTQEEEEKRFNRILAGVSVFAVISVIWDFCSIVKDAAGLGQDSPWGAWFARGFIALGLVLIAVLWSKILRKKSNETNND